MDVPENIKYLSLKWKKGTLTEQEKIELRNWYDTPLPTSLELEGSDEQELKALLFKKIKNALGYEEQRTIVKFPVWLKVAAAVILFFGMSFLAYQYFNKAVVPAANEQVVSAGEIRRVILPDSSIVWLKGKSKLSYPATFGKTTRDVSLSGEALFEIRHDTRWPFVVRSGHYTTTVLGTSFNLKTGAGDRDFDISVLTGKVGVMKIISGQDSKVVFVSANQTFKAESDKVQSLGSLPKKEIIQEITAGTQYDMAFEKTPVEEIMHRFEQKFDVHFEGYTGEYKSCKITADLTNQPLQQSLRLLCGAINATYKIHDNKIQLTGGGCFDE
ncbi:FecR family protein [Mucilaginibacter sp. ZT4R22]|uniref:FecR family protein n=1 Tax=Mucilaginibacter pankratovii TaxID=2772110 RepID=A0ABR7WK03_9SPHI|nr:FecR family protein [Mucilaginibacter pankratovii]MBD1362654.1 FecR family protein [Mucilaginibacter pankratovii]